MIDKNLTSKIIKTVIGEYFNDCLKDMKYTTGYGYEPKDSIYSYAEKIGSVFKENNIEFVSLFDKGFADSFLDTKKMSLKDKNFALDYIEKCKITPSADFLNQFLGKRFQINLLNKTLSLFDFQTCRKNEKENSSIIQILSDYKILGVNSHLVNQEVTEKAHYDSFKDGIHPAIFVSYINNGFYFNDSALQDMKTDYGRHYQMNPKLIKHIEQFFQKNTENKAKEVYDNLDYELPLSPIKKTPKI